MPISTIFKAMGYDVPPGMEQATINPQAGKVAVSADIADKLGVPAGTMMAASDVAKYNALLGKTTHELTQGDIDSNKFWSKTGKSVGDSVPISTYNQQTRTYSGGSGSTLTPEQNHALVLGIQRKDNPIPLTLIRSRGPAAAALAEALIADPNYNPSKAEISLAGSKSAAVSSARFAEAGPGQMVARVANSAMEQLDNLQTVSDAFPRSNIKMLNTPILAIDEQTMPEASAWKVAMNTARMEYATALNRGNTPTEQTLHEAIRALPDTITMAQLPSAIKQMRIGLTNTVKGMTTRVAPGGSAAPEKQAAIPSNHATLLDKYGAP
jgi:hypothetical protein